MKKYTFALWNSKNKQQVGLIDLDFIPSIGMEIQLTQCLVKIEKVIFMYDGEFFVVWVEKTDEVA